MVSYIQGQLLKCVGDENESRAGGREKKKEIDAKQVTVTTLL